jgi:hypothetical protein
VRRPCDAVLRRFGQATNRSTARWGRAASQTRRRRFALAARSRATVSAAASAFEQAIRLAVYPSTGAPVKLSAEAYFASQYTPLTASSR